MSLYRRAFGWYVRRRIARGLDGLWVSGLEQARSQLQRGPVVFAATHVAWWDGLLLLPLDEALGGGGRVWMEATNLRRLPYLGPLGALPLDSSSAAGLRRSVRAALSWLDGPGRSLWIFPQGRQRPSWLRPLSLAPGAGRVARLSTAALVPVALQYGFREAPVPRAVISFGPPVTPSALDALEDGLLEQLLVSDRFLMDGEGDFTALVPSRASAARTEQGLAARALGWWVGRG